MAVNYLAVLVASVVSMGIGFIWYGPLFGKVWMKLTNISKKKIEEAKQKGMAKTYLVAFLGALVTNFVLAGSLAYAGAQSIFDGLTVAIWLWLGFVATTTLALFSGKASRSSSISSIMRTIWSRS